MKCLSLTQKICIVIYLFMAIFQPNIFGISTFKIILLVDFAAFGFLVCKYQKIIFNRQVLWIFAGFIPFIIYMVASALLHMSLYPENTGVYFNNIFSSILPLFHSFILSLVMVQLISIKKISYSDIEKFLLYVSLIQLVCVVLALLSSNIRNIFINIMLRDADKDRIADFMRYGSIRMYGLARNLFDLFGYIVSMLITLIFLKGVSENKNIYKLLAIALLIIPLLNARTGLMLTLVGFTIVLIFYYEPKKSHRYIFGGIVAIIIVVAIFSFLPEKNAEWLTKGFDDTLTYIKTGEKVGVYSQILEADIVYPSNYVMGDCGSPEALANYRGIDSGYIQCLWRFGIIGSALLFLGYLNMFLMAAFRNRTKKVYCTITVLAMLFFVYLFKLYALDNAASNILVFGIPISLLVCSKLKHDEKFQLFRMMLKENV